MDSFCFRSQHNPTPPPPSLLPRGFMASGFGLALGRDLGPGCCCVCDHAALWAGPGSGTWGSLRWHLCMAAHYLAKRDQPSLMKCLNHVLVACAAPRGVFPSEEEVPSDLGEVQRFHAAYKFEVGVVDAVAEALGVLAQARAEFGVEWGHGSASTASMVREHAGPSAWRLYNTETHVGLMVETAHLCAGPVAQCSRVLCALRHLVDQPHGRQSCVNIASVFAAADLIRGWQPRVPEAPEAGQCPEDLKGVVACLVWLARSEGADRAVYSDAECIERVVHNGTTMATFILREVCVAPITCAVTKMPRFASPALWEVLATHPLLKCLLLRDWFGGGADARAASRLVLREAREQVCDVLGAGLVAGRGRGSMGCAVEGVLSKLLEAACADGL